jgi:hypothetical protein
MRCLLASALVVAVVFGEQKLRRKSEDDFPVLAPQTTGDEMRMMAKAEEAAPVSPATTTGAAPLVDVKTKCAAHKLCGLCNHDSECIWCADGEGTCIPGSEKGPDEKGVCKNYEVDYCLNEPCSAYTNCHTCTMDPFCGFCHGTGPDDKICVEGEKGGPLTGYCPPSRWDHAHAGPRHLKCSNSDYYETKLLAGATGIINGDEAAAAAAIADMEKVASTMAGNAKNAIDTESKLLYGEKKSFGLVGHIKHLIQMWKLRKKKIFNAEDLDRGFFEAKVNELRKQRRERLLKLQTIEKEMVGDVRNDAILMARRGEQEGKLSQASLDDDAALVSGESADIGEFAHHDWGGGLGAHLAKSDASWHALEKYLEKMSYKHKRLLKNLGRKARKALEKEMHASAVRKMAKQEASWYACAFLMMNPEAKCFEFHDKYAGVEKARELTAEEDTRVCNQVKSYIETQLKEKPSFSVPAEKTEYQRTGIQKDMYLGWCINNVHVEPKFAATDAI